MANTCTTTAQTVAQQAGKAAVSIAKGFAQVLGSKS